ncbi:MAG: RsmE family RNA methyltransferase [Simkaniaceae bacterium]|nr:RsmE family RNA methyltransferase [Candidatus Sacchlamyda saccharinae]
MPHNRFFSDQPFKKKDLITLSSDECKHLRVMRKDIGDTIELVNGQNQLAHAQVQSPTEVLLTEVHTSPPPSRQIILAQALLKPKNLDLVIEKGTELGATTFLLFPAEKSDKTTLSTNQLNRCRHLTISALKQCGRLDLPHIELRPPLAKWTTFPSNAYYGSLNSNISYTPPLKDTCLFVGPEGGFTPEEEALLAQKAQGVRIHPYTLRAETAALCFLSLSS